jgi:hypothetical protein
MEKFSRPHYIVLWRRVVLSLSTINLFSFSDLGREEEKPHFAM